MKTKTFYKILLVPSNWSNGINYENPKRAATEAYNIWGSKPPSNLHEKLCSTHGTINLNAPVEYTDNPIHKTFRENDCLILEVPCLVFETDGPELIIPVQNAKEVFLEMATYFTNKS